MASFLPAGSFVMDGMAMYGTSTDGRMTAEVFSWYKASIGLWLGISERSTVAL